MQEKLPDDLLKIIASITNKRAKIVLDHIIEHGFITTETLENTYGYSHPPRAARDVREAGIPLETFTVKSKLGKSIAAYKFGDITQIQHHKIAGRKIFSKDFKNQLYATCNGKCAVCNGHFEERYLQIDHCIPYEISGDTDAFQQNFIDYRLLCAPCNRAKSWSCEHCDNWIWQKERTLCETCYWANSTQYDHIALQAVRRLELIWQQEDLHFFEILKAQAHKGNIELSEYVKKLIESYSHDK
jgi:hypothetical protein